MSDIVNPLGGLPVQELETAFNVTTLRTKGGRDARVVDNRRPNGITQSQYMFIIDLLHERDILKHEPFECCVRIKFDGDITAAREFIILEVYKSNRQRASEIIKTLLSLPRAEADGPQPGRSRITVDYREVEVDGGKTRRIGYLTDGEVKLPAGNYALDTSGPGESFANDTTFFKVWIGSRYGWKVMMYRSDDEIELERGFQVRIARMLLADPTDAAARYGREKCRCSICNRKLTKDISRTRGIGPVCADKWGM